MKRIVCVTALAVLAASAAPAWATNGYQLTGVGQMQNSMGGAVTAAPMDTMTAISNPAGMARVGERADFSMEAFMPVRSVSFAPIGGEGTKGGTSLYGIPSVGWVAKAFGRENTFFGGGMFVTSGLGVDYGDILFTPDASALNPLLPAAPVRFSGYSAIQFWKMAPTVAWNQNDRTSFGVSLNLDYQSVTIQQTFTGAMPINMDLGRPTNQLGLGVTLGAMYDVGDAVTVGVSYASKQSFPDAEYRLQAGDLDFTGRGGSVMPAGTYKLGLDYPQQAAVGIAVNPSERLLVDLDVKWINWSDTHDVVKLKGGGGVTPLNFGWDDQMVYALGAQYGVSERLKVRAGLNYGKSPIGTEDVFNNLVFPAIVEKHAMLGFDYQLGEHWGLGATYMKAFKNTLTNTDPAFPVPVQISLAETSVGVLLDYKF